MNKGTIRGKLLLIIVASIVQVVPLSHNHDYLHYQYLPISPKLKMQAQPTRTATVTND